MKRCTYFVFIEAKPFPQQYLPVQPLETLPRVNKGEESSKQHIILANTVYKSNMTSTASHMSFANTNDVEKCMYTCNIAIIIGSTSTQH